MNKGSDYRERIYQHYASAREQALVPKNIEGLNPRKPYLNKLIERHFPADRNAAILDLGCGYGALIHFARLAGYSNITGIDRSPQQIEEAKRLSIMGVKQDDLMESLRSLPDDSQDAVIAFDVIEHFTKDELLSLIDEVYRVLREGGRWILHMPNAISPFFGRIRYGDYTHEQAFTAASITQLLHAAGFRKVKCFEDAPVVHGLKSMLRWLIWRLIQGLLRVYMAAETGSTNEIFTQNFLTVAQK